MLDDIIWVLIPLAPFILGGFVVWTKHQQRVLDHQSQATAEKAAQYATNNKELEERVRVLERIVTDGGYNVATQIEALRDQRRVEEKIEGSKDPAVN